MPVITKEELENASVDANDLEKFINESATYGDNSDGEYSTRLNNDLITLKALIVRLRAAIADVQSGLSSTLSGYAPVGHTHVFNPSHEHELSELINGGNMDRLMHEARTITDWNDATENGFYTSTGGATVSNAPTGSVATHTYLGIILAADENNLLQVAYETETNKTWQRERASGTWGSWEQQYRTSADLDSYISTTQRPTASLTDWNDAIKKRYIYLS